MATHKELQAICDRGLSALAEVKQHVITLANLDGEIVRAETTLRGLQAQAEQVQPMIAEIEGLDQRIRAKRSELATLEAAIAKGNEQHGAVVSKLRDLRKQISGDPTHA